MTKEIGGKEKKGKLHRKKELAMLALLESSTVAEAAKAVKLGEATLYNWIRDEAFQKDYRALKQEIVGPFRCQTTEGFFIGSGCSGRDRQGQRKAVFCPGDVCQINS